MLKFNKKQINSIKIGYLVLFKVHEVDRGKSNANNLLCYVIKVKTEQGVFQFACKAGVLVNDTSGECYFAWNAFQKVNLVTDFTKADIPTEKLEKIERKTAFGPIKISKIISERGC
jgi:hypothetical protein